ncbi:Trypsin [Popillia japonica]|uniref:CLIP domain-containing serine protease n=1 Tax=Popillia japonica TaxID=7064 RepID=A0AAW1LS38_POPJA
MAVLTGWAVDDTGCRTPDKGTGFCVRISECKTMMKFLKCKKMFSEKEKEALRSYRCGFYQDEPKVCCNDEPITLGWIVDSDRCRTPDGTDSVCVPLEDCKVMYNFIRENAVNDLIRETLSKYRCDNTGSIKVCCPNKLPTVLTESRISDHTQHPNAKLLSEFCGNSATDDKIVNGNVTNLFEFPWAVVLKYDKKVNPWSCGASLISERYVLTAAHCIRSKSKLTTVRLGEHDFDKNPDCQEAQKKICADPPQDFEISTEDAIVHPNYNPETYQNDIALIRLPRPANTTTFSVSPVCLPLTEAEKSFVYKDYTVIGWGATETGFSSKILLKVSVPKVDNTICAPKYEARLKLTDNQMCAGGKNEQDSCAGDSGGPLTNDYVLNGSFKTIQYGIVSLGPVICGREEFPAIYTRVDKYVGWILDNMKP